jgi:hypothetical protein
MLRIIPLRWNNPQLNLARSASIFGDDWAKSGKFHRRTITKPSLRLITIQKMQTL